MNNPMRYYCKCPDDVSKLIYDKFGFTVRIAIETEFYISNISNKHGVDIVKIVKSEFYKYGINDVSIKSESGLNQYEYNTNSMSDISGLISKYQCIRSLINQTAKKLGAHALFSPKPYRDMPGSGMHIHLSLEDRHGTNAFKKKIQNSMSESSTMLNVVSGLINTLENLFVIFAPEEENYSRLHGYHDGVDKEAIFAPSYLCWGGDNRLCAIRIPTSTLDPKNRHIEHRVPAPNSDLDQVLSAILVGVYGGLSDNETPKLSKLYGLPYDPQFKLKKLPLSLDKAYDLFNPELLVEKYGIALAI